MSLAKTHQIRDAVEIVVGPDDDKVRQLMGRCSVMASASEYEGFGVAAVEAMSAGLFPLVSDIPAFRRLVTRVDAGMLVDFSDVEAAADEFIGKWREIESDYLRYRRNLSTPPRSSIGSRFLKNTWNYMSMFVVQRRGPFWVCRFLSVRL